MSFANGWQRGRVFVVIAVVAVMVAIACMAGLGYYLFTLDSELQRESAARVAADIEGQKLTEDVNALRAQVISEGEKPVVPAPADPTPPSRDLTDSEVRALALQIVRDYGVSEQAVTALVDAAVARVETTPGPPGEPGPEPSPQVVMDATEAIVVPFLQANPPPPGPAGEDGQDSTTPGPAGQDGADGADGADGRGIETAAFDAASCMLRFTYTDGTSQELGPVCGEDAFPFTIRFTFTTFGNKEVTVTCELTEASSEPTNCTTEEQDPVTPTGENP